MSRIPLEIAIAINDTFDNNLEWRMIIPEYLKEGYNWEKIWCTFHLQIYSLICFLPNWFLQNSQAVLAAASINGLKTPRECFNPFTLRATKTGLAILKIVCLQKYFLENIWRRNVDQMPYNNSPSNILWILALFLSYFQKYESSRR